MKFCYFLVCCDKLRLSDITTEKNSNFVTRDLKYDQIKKFRSLFPREQCFPEFIPFAWLDCQEPFP